MAEPPVDASQVSAIFPDPPPFWRDFTTEKIEQIESLRIRYAEQTGLDPSAVLRVPDVPDELINLQPPPEPAEGTWRLYGEPATLNIDLQSLEAAGIDTLVPTEGSIDGKHIDRALELKRLAKSLLLNFLECMGVMGTNPAQVGLPRFPDQRPPQHQLISSPTGKRKGSRPPHAPPQLPPYPERIPPTSGP
jgi:mediator of RNA polymerase II transcription subunit 7